jgi:hypothetical protein
MEAKSCSFMGVVPFQIRVEQDGRVASAWGQIQEYSVEESDEAIL